MGTSVAAPARLSFEEFEALPDHSGPQHLELLEGQLIRMPPAQNRHAESAEKLFELFKAAVAELLRRQPEPPIGNVHHERGYRITADPPSWLQPDVSVAHRAQPVERSYIGAPLIAFDTVSEFDNAPDRERNADQYLRHGAAEVWLIYPDLRYTRVHRPRDPAAVRHEKAIATPLLPGIEIPFDSFL